MFMKNKNDCDFTIRVSLLVLFVSLITILVYCFSDGISGNDFWWHVKVGEWIVNHGKVPTTDIFSWYGVEQGIVWTAHEWLADVIFFKIHSTFGNIGIFALSFCAALMMILLMYNQAREHIKRNILVGGLFFLLFTIVASLFFYGRPHIFSYFFLFFELKILYDFLENTDSKKIYLIPLIAVLWSNLHGGSSNLSYIICAIFLFAGLLNFSFGRIEAIRMDKMSLLKLAGVTLASVAGILLNPIGTEVLAYPYVTLNDQLSMSLISEWQSPDAKLIGNLLLYFLPIAVMTIGLISTKKKVKIIDAFIMFAFLFLFFRSARFIVLWYIAAVFYAFQYMPELKVKPITKTYEKVTVGMVTVLLLILMTMGLLNMSNAYKKDKLISQTMSEEIIEVIKADAPKRLYNDYNLGEALIYNDISVFFDARADLYVQNNLMADGVSLMYLEQANIVSELNYVDVDELINKYGFDALVVLKVRPLYSYIVSHPDRFKLIYEEENIGYFRVKGLQGD